MALLRALGRAYVVDRVMRGGGNRSYARGRGRGGFWGPLPYYSRRTRGGSRVTVTGCCLPIPLGMLAAAAAAWRLLLRR